MTQNEYDEGIWVLGYGSLIYKPPPHYTQRIPATIYGFMRRFWQSSIDHRGVPSFPGRVVTLLPYDEIMKNDDFKKELEFFGTTINNANDLTTVGVVYYIPPEYAREVREYLDVREQNGYTLHRVEVHLEPSTEQERELGKSLNVLPIDKTTGKHVLNTTVYIGTTENEAFVGPETIPETAAVIAKAHGPSGSNYVYLKMLHDSLHNMPVHKNMVVADTYLDSLLETVDRLMK